ncbi:MAG: methyltransferase domain-containing protein [Thermodesulfobacteriota bacterium]
MPSEEFANTSPALKYEDLWKVEVMEEFDRLLKQDCAQYFQSENDPVAAGVAVMAPCVFCEGSEFSPLFRQQAYTWVRCRDCGLLQKLPRPTIEAQTRFYREGKALDFFEEKVLKADQEIRQKKIFNPYLERLDQLVQQHSWTQGTLLDIGCSGGHFLAAARERQLLSYFAGVEANPINAEKARQLGFTVYPVMFEEAEIPPESFDIITCFSTIQLVNSPMAILRKCQQILRPGGVVVFTSPNGWAPDILLLQETSPVLPCHLLQLPDPRSFALACSRAGLSETYVEALGQLDVQIVQESWQALPPDLNNPLAEFLYRIFVDLNTPELAGDLQSFLKKYNLSGHLWMQARKI